MRSWSLGGHSTGRYDADDDHLVERAARQACERLAGLTVINHATQLAITLTPEALKAAAAPGMPAELLRILPHVPQLLSDALYVRIIADPLKRRGVRRLYILANSSADPGRTRDVVFRVRENLRSQCFLDRVALRHIAEHHRADGGEIPGGDAGTAPTGKAAVTPRYVFVGGWGDHDFFHNVERYADDFRQTHGGDVQYFTWTDKDGVKNAITGAPAGTPVYGIGHSYGGNTLAQAIGELAPNGVHVAKAITIDPVGQSSVPDGFRSAVGQWINVTAVPAYPNPINGDWAASAGGKGGQLPVDQADETYNVGTHHANFTEMMRTLGPDGVSPEQILLGDGDPAP
jgi:hypothetical protein